MKSQWCHQIGDDRWFIRLICFICSDSSADSTLQSGRVHVHSGSHRASAHLSAQRWLDGTVQVSHSGVFRSSSCSCAQTCFIEHRINFTFSWFLTGSSSGLRTLTVGTVSDTKRWLRNWRVFTWRSSVMLWVSLSHQTSRSLADCQTSVESVQQWWLSELESEERERQQSSESEIRHYFLIVLRRLYIHDTEWEQRTEVETAMWPGNSGFIEPHPHTLHAVIGWGPHTHSPKTVAQKRPKTSKIRRK